MIDVIAVIATVVMGLASPLVPAALRAWRRRQARAVVVKQVVPPADRVDCAAPRPRLGTSRTGSRFRGPLREREAEVIEALVSGKESRDQIAARFGVARHSLRLFEQSIRELS